MSHEGDLFEDLTELEDNEVMVTSQVGGTVSRQRIASLLPRDIEYRPCKIDWHFMLDLHIWCCHDGVGEGGVAASIRMVRPDWSRPSEVISSRKSTLVDERI